MADLLYEIGVEELPASYIAPAIEQLEAALERELKEAKLSFGSIKTAATPRRLAIAVRDVEERQADREEEISGPPAKAAFDGNGNPTKALEGFARSQGAQIADIQRKMTPRGEYCFIRRSVKGRATGELLAEILPRITAAISFPKSMSWISGERSFARPVRALVAIFGDEIVNFALFGVKTGRITEGHPILSPGEITLKSPDFDEYRKVLLERKIVVEMSKREEIIRAEIAKVLKESGGDFREESLLREVTNLAQWPSVTVGEFDAEFLKVPSIVVETAMMEHQRYFPMRNAAGKLLNRFMFVSDRSHDHDNVIRLGNEQVLQARLSDARFFHEQDRKHRLEERAEKLTGVFFLRGLGTYFDKVQRLEKLAKICADALKLDADSASCAVRAAKLCKADLLTEIVGEFPALQGEMGRIYARAEGEPEQVADAIAEHYLPRSSDGALPVTDAGTALSIAEKVDNIVGCFALGLIPSGSQDPYALRRQSQGLMRMIEMRKAHFSLSELLRKGMELLPEKHRKFDEALPKLMEFLKDRLFQTALERGFPHDLIRAALTPGFDDICDFFVRLEAIKALSGDKCWQELVISVERTFNIGKSAPVEGAVDAALLSAPEETKVCQLLRKHGNEILKLESERRYQEAGRKYAEVFAAPLHDFFDKVFVNVDDEKVRKNRLLLMREANRLFSARVADLSEITTGVIK